MSDEYRGKWSPFNNAFKSDKGAIYKLIAGFLFGIAFAAYISIKRSQELTFGQSALILAILPPLCVILTGAFLRADVVRRRLAAGESVDLVSRALFGAGICSLLIWIFLFMAAAIPFALWYGKISSGV